MKTCKWIKYMDENLYHLECGGVQGINVRPHQKICSCGKRIKRINVNELSEPTKYLLAELGGKA